MEELEHAKARGAKIYGEIVGYGATGDAYHMTAPCPDGDGAARAIRLAMDEAGITPEQVDYINAHGTSTHANDAEKRQRSSWHWGMRQQKLRSALPNL